ncbi:malectin domain-containing carbohydrate-binding protein [Natrialbaceae archaeon A-chndr2]
MKVDNNNRGVSHLIGAVLALAILIVLLAIWQVQVIPQENAALEFEHDRQVSGDLQDLRNAIISSPSQRADRTVDVRLGTSYPERTVFINPPDPTGHIRTIDERDGDPLELVVSKAHAVDNDSGEETVWNGSERRFETALIAYEPRYYASGSSPRHVYEHSVLYAERDGGRIATAEQELIDGRSISLVALDGRLNEQGSMATVGIEPDGAALRTVSVTADDGPIVLEFPTLIENESEAEDEWETLLESEREDGYVEDISVADGIVEVTLQEQDGDGDPVQYELTLAEATLSNPGTPSSSTVQYLRLVDGPERIAPGDTAEFTLEARNVYDNPLAHEQLQMTVLDGDEQVVDQANASTRRRGQATFRYEVPDDPPDTLTIEIAHDEVTGTLTRELTVFTPGDGTDSGTGGGPAGGIFEVSWNESETVELGAGETMSLEATLRESLSGIPLNFGVERSDVVSLNRTTANTDGGSASVDIERVDDDDGESYVYVWTNDGGDRLRIVAPPPAAFLELFWETASDWAAGVGDRVVADAVGDREADTIRLGYDGDTDGLIGYWPLDESAGSQTAVDGSGNGNDASVVGTIEQGQDGILSSTSYGFGESDSYLEVADDETLDVDDELTISVWIHPENLGGAQGIVSKRNSWNDEQAFSLFAYNEDRLYVDIDGTSNRFASNTVLEEDRWYHVVVVYDGAAEETRLYVDGQLDTTSQAVSSIPAYNSSLTIGELDTNRGAEFNGRIDEVRLYDRALSTAEVGSLFDTTNTGSFTTDWRTSEETLSSDRLQLENVSATIPPGTSATVTVEADTTGSGTLDASSDPISIENGVSEYEITGIDADADTFRVIIEFETTDPERTPVVDSMGIGEREPAVVFAVNAGGDEYTAADGTVYQADTNFQGGTAYSTSEPIDGTDDDTLYQSERYGDFSYAVPLEDGTYAVTLEFAEIYWDVDAAGGSGSRVFDVDIEGERVLDAYDIYDDVGALQATERTFVTEVTDGELSIDFSTIADNAKISAIRVEEVDSPSGSFAVSSLEPPHDTRVGETVTASATVQNTGDSGTTQRVEYRVDGVVVNSTDVTLGAGEQRTVDFTYRMGAEPLGGLGPGTYDHEIRVDENAATTAVDTTLGINFQTYVGHDDGDGSDVAPAGFIPDFGFGYGDRGFERGTNDGYQYGWVDSEGDPFDHSERARNRDPDAGDPVDIDQTLNHFVVNTPSEWDPAEDPYWQLAVPNGTYAIELRAGDPSFSDQELSFDVNDLEFRDDVFDGSSRPDDNRNQTYRGVVNVTDGSLTVSPPLGTDNPKINALILSPVEPAVFNVTALSTNEPVERGSELQVEATVTNTGDRSDTQPIEFAINGTNIDTENLTLGPQDSTTVSFTDSVFTDTDSDLEVAISSANETRSQTVSVLQPAFFAPSDLSPDTAMTGETVSISADVTNTGDLEGTQTITYELDAYSVAIVDSAEVHGPALEETLSERLPETYETRVIDTETAVDEIDEYDVFVVQHLDTDDAAAFVQAVAASEAGVVYLDQYTENSGSDSNGIEQRAAHGDDAFDYDNEYTFSAGADVTITAYHPIVEDVAEAGQTVPLHNADWSDRFWITGYDGMSLATVPVSNDDPQTTLYVSDEDNEVLFGAGRTDFITNDEYSDQSNEILANAVEYVTRQPTYTTAATLEGNDSTTVTFEVPMPDTKGTYVHRVSTANETNTGSITIAVATQQDFSGDQPDDWSTAGTAEWGNSIDGEDSLQLTDTGTNEVGLGVYDGSFDSEAGISASFSYYADSEGDFGADGLTFFLVDAEQSVDTLEPGPSGGSLGYGRGDEDGIDDAFVGIGFDSWGNFRHDQDTGQDGHYVVARGSESDNYAAIEVIELTDGQTIDGGWRDARVDIDTRGGETTITVEMQFTDSGPWITVIDDATYDGDIPETVTFGFTAATGGSTNVHAIGDVEVGPLANDTE